jgi:DNA-binding transcriptional MerR regulator
MQDFANLLKDLSETLEKKEFQRILRLHHLPLKYAKKYMQMAGPKTAQKHPLAMLTRKPKAAARREVVVPPEIVNLFQEYLNFEDFLKSLNENQNIEEKNTCANLLRSQQKNVINRIADLKAQINSFALSKGFLIQIEEKNLKIHMGGSLCVVAGTVDPEQQIIILANYLKKIPMEMREQREHLIKDITDYAKRHQVIFYSTFLRAKNKLVFIRKNLGECKTWQELEFFLGYDSKKLETILKDAKIEVQNWIAALLKRYEKEFPNLSAQVQAWVGLQIYKQLHRLDVQLLCSTH